jgi:hypothetical protein
MMSSCSCSPDPATDAALLDTPGIDTPVLDTPGMHTRDDVASADVASADVPTADVPGLDVPSALEPNCDLDDVLCESLPPACDEGETPTVVGICWGECIPADECRCRTFDDCPSITGYSEVCYSAGHCGPAL